MKIHNENQQQFVRKILTWKYNGNHPSFVKGLSYKWQFTTGSGS